MCDNYGIVKVQITLVSINKLSNCKLKAALRNLKHSSGDDVAMLLWSRLNKDQANYETEYNHDVHFKKDYWKYYRTTFEPEEHIKPDTNEGESASSILPRNYVTKINRKCSKISTYPHQNIMKYLPLFEK